MSDSVKKKEKQGIVTLDLEKFLPEPHDIAVFDLKEYLYKELIIKEKEFRDKLAALDLHPYQNRFVSVVCSSDAIIPTWAYMLVSATLNPVSKLVSHNSGTKFLEEIIWHRFQESSKEDYRDARVVIKGCGNVDLSMDIYIKITALLQPEAKAIMFGEPCSTVPVFRR